MQQDDPQAKNNQQQWNAAVLFMFTGFYLFKSVYLPSQYILRVQSCRNKMTVCKIFLADAHYAPHAFV